MFFFLFNPLYSDEFSHTDCKSNKHGIILSIIYFKGSQIEISHYDVFPSLRISFTITNSVGPDEMLQYAGVFRIQKG